MLCKSVTLWDTVSLYAYKKLLQYFGANLFSGMFSDGFGWPWSNHVRIRKITDDVMQALQLEPKQNMIVGGPAGCIFVLGLEGTIGKHFDNMRIQQLTSCSDLRCEGVIWLNYVQLEMPKYTGQWPWDWGRESRSKWWRFEWRSARLWAPVETPVFGQKKRGETSQQAALCSTRDSLVKMAIRSFFSQEEAGQCGFGVGGMSNHPGRHWHVELGVLMFGRHFGHVNRTQHICFNHPPSPRHRHPHDLHQYQH